LQAKPEEFHHHFQLDEAAYSRWDEETEAEQ